MRLGGSAIANYKFGNSDVQKIFRGAASVYEKVVSNLPWLIYLDGQSNSVGLAANTGLPAHLKLQMTDANTGGGTAYIWSPIDGLRTGAGSWAVLESGINSRGYAASSDGTLDDTKHGCELQLAYHIAKNIGVDVYVVKVGVAGTGLGQTAYDDHNIASVGELHDHFKSTVANAETALTNAGITFIRKGWLWQQGEYDARDGNDTLANAYGTNLTDKINAVRAFIGDSTLPAIIVRLKTGITRNATLIPIIQGHQDNVSATLSNVTIINPDPYPVTDGVHYSTDGYNFIADDAYEVISKTPLPAHEGTIIEFTGTGIKSSSAGVVSSTAANARGVGNKKLLAGDGYVQFDLASDLDVSDRMIVGLDALDGASAYQNFDYGAYHTGPTSKITTLVSGSGTGTTQTVSTHGIVRMERIGSSLVWKYSSDGEKTFTDLRTVTGVPTGEMFIKIEFLLGGHSAKGFRVFNKGI